MLSKKTDWEEMEHGLIFADITAETVGPAFHGTETGNT